jgi:hypothetical protein
MPGTRLRTTARRPVLRTTRLRRLGLIESKSLDYHWKALRDAGLDFKRPDHLRAPSPFSERVPDDLLRPGLCDPVHAHHVRDRLAPLVHIGRASASDMQYEIAVLARDGEADKCYDTAIFLVPPLLTADEMALSGETAVLTGVPCLIENASSEFSPLA